MAQLLEWLSWEGKGETSWSLLLKPSQIPQGTPAHSTGASGLQLPFPGAFGGFADLHLALGCFPTKQRGIQTCSGFVTVAQPLPCEGTPVCLKDW